MLVISEQCLLRLRVAARVSILLQRLLKTQNNAANTLGFN